MISWVFKSVVRRNYLYSSLSESYASFTFSSSWEHFFSWTDAVNYAVDDQFLLNSSSILRSCCCRQCRNAYGRCRRSSPRGKNWPPERPWWFMTSREKLWKFENITLVRVYICIGCMLCLMSPKCRWGEELDAGDVHGTKCSNVLLIARWVLRSNQWT